MNKRPRSNESDPSTNESELSLSMLEENNITEYKQLSHRIPRLINLDIPRKIPDMIEALIPKKYRRDFRRMKELNYDMFWTASCVPPSTESQFSKEWIYYSSIISAVLKVIENKLKQKQDFKTITIHEHLYSILVEQCVSLFDIRDCVVVRDTCMPLTKTKHKNTPTLIPSFVVGFWKSSQANKNNNNNNNKNINNSNSNNELVSVGTAVLPFLIGVQVVDEKETEKGKVELALQMQRAIDYQDDYFGPSNGRMVAGFLFREYGVDVFLMTKIDSKYEMEYDGMYHWFALQEILVLAHHMWRMEYFARQILNNEPVLPYPIDPSEVIKQKEKKEEAETKYPPAQNYEYIGNDLIYEKTYSKVYKAKDEQGKIVVIKQKAWQHYPAIPIEVEMLQKLGGSHNTLKLLDFFESDNDEDEDNNNKTHFPKCYNCVFEFVDHQEPSTLDEIKIYMKQLLQALVYCGNNGIIHRDVKPANILFDPHSSKATLIDFGSAIVVGERWYSYQGTKGYYAPELSIEGRREANYSMVTDVWSAGVIFLDLMMGVEYEYQEDDQQKKTKTDSDDIEINYDGDDTQKEVIANLARMKQRKPLLTKEGLDLVEEMLEVDRWKRITARQALGHEFFF